MADKDTLVRPRRPSAVAELFPQAEAHVVEGGSHLVNVQSVVPVADRIVEFGQVHAGGPDPKPGSWTCTAVRRVLGLGSLPMRPMFDTINSKGSDGSGRDGGLDAPQAAPLSRL
eukprot:TRINITY_DN56376_c0_g1_i1.p1 TRINITY_DN56376_c0_g1~~TRINITY_DN56376_c0_g1_i1.p1  ORF type:complete len:114 (-),score=10.21 TRINITY_DN56376_c0_g1_i1:447-788(-)